MVSNPTLEESDLSVVSVEENQYFCNFNKGIPVFSHRSTSVLETPRQIQCSYFLPQVISKAAVCTCLRKLVAGFM